MAPVDLEPLYDALMTTDSAVTRKAVAGIASRVDQLDPAQIPDVVEALSSLFYIDLGDKPQYVQVVEDTVAAIASIGAAAIPTIMFLMCEADLKATLMHGRTLGRMGPAAYGPLKDLFYRAENPHQKVLALFALAKMHEAALMEIFPDLAIALDDSDREVRDTAARTMGRVISAFKPGQLPHDQVSQAFERLMFRLSDNSPVVRAKVVRSIGKMAGKGYLDREQLEMASEAVNSLLGTSSSEPDPWYLVRKEAEEALGKIREKNK
jgi:hypothetical protein